ncbi:MAG: CAP domain-containing protein [Actinomycetota bacterium]|nr:CAP domain-containing protein [Actinomycetota bacterium]
MKLNEDEKIMLDLVNSERASRGIKTLAADSRLVIFARSYAHEMAAHDFFSHVSPITGNLLSRVNRAGFKYWVLAGENLADAPSSEDAFRALMESPSHKANLLNPTYDPIGIGAVDGGDYGTIYVQEFMAFESRKATSKAAGKL